MHGLRKGDWRLGLSYLQQLQNTLPWLHDTRPSNPHGLGCQLTVSRFCLLISPWIGKPEIAKHFPRVWGNIGKSVLITSKLILGSVSSCECLGAPVILPTTRGSRVQRGTNGWRMSLSAKVRKKQQKSTTKSTNKVKSTLKLIICRCFYLTHIFEVWRFEVLISRFFWACFSKPPDLHVTGPVGLEGLWHQSPWHKSLKYKNERLFLWL